MASRSKKRRRVLGASCILAALIIAGSSFAWFTAKDEVTNRLSANADYDVKIVESFAPPANWLPGQEVNKDVYAINTGSISAFVREDVSGVLTITVEKATNDLTENSVQLTDEERYIMEAGSYLAYKPANSTAELGSIIVVRPDDQEYYTRIYPAGQFVGVDVPAQAEFKPDVEGLYVFRRTIEIANSEGLPETFEYDGYYFKNKKYYKISNLTCYRADDTGWDDDAYAPDDGRNDDGILVSATAGFYETEQKLIDPIDITYDATNNRLVATYDTGNANAAAKYIELAKAVDAAKHAYDVTDRAYEAALLTANEYNTHNNASGEYNQAMNELTAAEMQLASAIAAYNAKYEAYVQAKIAKANALAEKEAAQAAVDASLLKLYGDGGTSLSTAKEGSLGKIYKDAQTAMTTATTNAGLNDASALANEIAAYNSATSSSLAMGTTDVDEWVAFMAWVDSNVAQNELHTYFTAAAKLAVAEINFINEFEKLTGSDVITTQLADSTEDSLYGKKLKADDDYETASTNYTTAESEYNTAKTNFENALARFKTANENAKAAEAKLAELNAEQNYWSALSDAASVAYDAAKDLYDTATDALENLLAASDGIIKININLSDKVAATTDGTKNDMWLLYQNPVVGNTAVFYYTGILEGGETSSKLIDSVTLDDSVKQGMYKSFDFDLNIALSSAQITYDADGNILADAAAEELGAVATVVTPTDVETALVWKTTEPAPAPAPGP